MNHNSLAPLFIRMFFFNQLLCLIPSWIQRNSLGSLRILLFRRLKKHSSNFEIISFCNKIETLYFYDDSRPNDYTLNTKKFGAGSFHTISWERWAFNRTFYVPILRKLDPKKCIFQHQGAPLSSSCGRQDKTVCQPIVSSELKALHLRLSKSATFPCNNTC